MEWREIKGTEDINELLTNFGYFHDSCLKEMIMWSGFHVNEETMTFGDGLPNNVRILFQGHYKETSAIELLFEGVEELHLGNAGFIYDVTFTYQDGMFFWADLYGVKRNDNRKDVTWIASKNIKWRDVSRWMGDTRRYGELGSS
ncbi:hypothetical protein [Sporosarcina cyprini]|uniref:hypothetical protein n=1 Tax=Sporosarcina cyprini TaxID=2910523 RepID=UPI001EDFED8B|nr:hypothetical protein [Sporosarcina cyprini]MCG3088541.1 hypothetical protein [Sporosarcina cyprini]